MTTLYFDHIYLRNCSLKHVCTPLSPQWMTEVLYYPSLFPREYRKYSTYIYSMSGMSVSNLSYQLRNNSYRCYIPNPAHTHTSTPLPLHKHSIHHCLTTTHKNKDNKVNSVLPQLYSFFLTNSRSAWVFHFSTFLKEMVDLWILVFLLNSFILLWEIFQDDDKFVQSCYPDNCWTLTLDRNWSWESQH